MNNESKKSKEENVSTIITTSGSNTADMLLLPEAMRNSLDDYIKKGFPDSTLDLSYKDIEDQVMPELCKCIVQLRDKIKILRLDGAWIQPKGGIILFEALKENKIDIIDISLRGNYINDECMKSIGEYIQSIKSVKRLGLSSNNITNKGIEIFTPYLEGNISLQHLFLEYNKGITEKSLPTLIKMITSSLIHNLSPPPSISKDALAPYTVENAFKGAASELELNSIDDEFVGQICHFIKKYGVPKLETLYLTGIKNGSTKTGLLFSTLKEYKSAIKTLSMIGDGIDDEFVKSFAEYLEDNQILDTLQLHYSNLSDTAVEILHNYLLGNIRLKLLDLAGNEKITDASGSHLKQLAKRTCIVKMNLKSTSVSKPLIEEIDSLLMLPTETREIPIQSNSKSASKGLA